MALRTFVRRNYEGKVTSEFNIILLCQRFLKQDEYHIYVAQLSLQYL